MDQYNSDGFYHPICMRMRCELVQVIWVKIYEVFACN